MLWRECRGAEEVCVVGKNIGSEETKFSRIFVIECGAGGGVANSVERGIRAGWRTTHRHSEVLIRRQMVESRGLGSSLCLQTIFLGHLSNFRARLEAPNDGWLVVAEMIGHHNVSSESAYA